MGARHPRRWASVGVAACGLLIVGASDKVIKPLLLGETSQFHPLLAFLASVGGVLTFGLVGVFIGPVVFSLLLPALRMYGARVEAAGT